MGNFIPPNEKLDSTPLKAAGVTISIQNLLSFLEAKTGARKKHLTRGVLVTKARGRFSSEAGILLVEKKGALLKERSAIASRIRVSSELTHADMYTL